MIEIKFKDIDDNEEYKNTVNNTLGKCFKTEKLNIDKIYICVTLTNNNNIKQINKQYRNIDKETDVLSFPMFEKNEINQIKAEKLEREEILGDIIISIEKVKEQAVEYEHSFERELAYMITHGFYHLMGYDHMEEDEKRIMRDKEENIMNILNLSR